MWNRIKSYLPTLPRFSKPSWIRRPNINWRFPEIGKIEANFVGRTIDVWTWNFMVRPAASLTAGLVIALILSILFGFSLMFFIFWTLAAIGIGYPDGKESVPVGGGAMVTLLGRRLDLYRTEGDYSWTGKIIFLDRSRVVKDEGTTDEGFILLKPFQVRIWNNSDDVRNVRISAQARNNATVTSTLTLSILLRNPRLWIENEDPVLALADRARESFRGAIRNFTDSDCLGLKNRLGQMVEGCTIITTFLPSSWKEGRPYSILRDRGGRMMTMTLSAGATDADISTAKASFSHEAEADGDTKQLTSCRGTGAAKEPLFIEAITVEKSIAAIVTDLGIEVMDAAIADLQSSKAVRDASDAASSEVEQRDAQTKSAATIADAAKKYGRAVRDEGQLAVALAAGADKIPGVKVIITGDSDPLTRAAATLGSLSKGDEE